MTLPLTVDTLRAAYDYLATTPPFNRWNLPEGEDITFKVANSVEHCAWYIDNPRDKRRMLIAVSRKFITTTNGLMTTMAHEMCHVHQLRHMRSESEHGPAWQRFADRVCRFHSFDRGLF